MGQCGSSETTPQVKEFVDAQIKDHKVVVFSKTYCPYCTMAKDSLKSVGCTDYTLIELDNRDDGDAIQNYMQSLTGGRTVPRVFISGKFVGGGSEVKELAGNGQLKKLIDA